MYSTDKETIMTIYFLSLMNEKVDYDNSKAIKI